MQQLILTNKGTLVEVDEKKSSRWLKTDPAIRALGKKVRRDSGKAGKEKKKD